MDPLRDPFLRFHDHVSPIWAQIKIEKEFKNLGVIFTSHFFKKKNNYTIWGSGCPIGHSYYL